jgi:hypothetical protein
MTRIFARAKGGTQIPNAESLCIGEDFDDRTKLFEEKFRPVGFAIKSVGPEGAESEVSVISESQVSERPKASRAHQYGNYVQAHAARRRYNGHSAGNPYCRS